MRKTVTDYETQEVVKPKTDYETVEIEKEILICDFCNKEAAELSDVYFGISISDPPIASYIKNLANKSRHFKNGRRSRPSFVRGPKVNTLETNLTGINEIDDIPPGEIKEIDIRKSYVSLATVKHELKQYNDNVSVEYDAKCELCSDCCNELEIEQPDNHAVDTQKRTRISLSDDDDQRQLIATLMVLSLVTTLGSTIIQQLIFPAILITTTALLLLFKEQL